MLRRAIGSVRHFRYGSTGSSTGSVPVRIKRADDEAFYRGRINSFLNSCSIYGREFEKSDEFVNEVTRAYKNTKNGKQDLIVYSKIKKGIQCVDIVKNCTSGFLTSGQNPKGNISDLMLKMREKPEVLIRTTKNVEFMGIIHESDRNINFGMVHDLVKNSAVRNRKIFTRNLTPIYGPYKKNTEDYRYVYKMKIIKMNEEFLEFEAIPVECVGIVYKEKITSLKFQTTVYEFSDSVSFFGPLAKWARDPFEFSQLTSGRKIKVSKKGRKMQSLLSEQNVRFLYEMDLLDSIDQLLWEQSLSLKATYVDDYKCDLDLLYHAFPKETTQSLKPISELGRGRNFFRERTVENLTLTLPITPMPVKLRSFSCRLTSLLEDITKVVKSVGVELPENILGRIFIPHSSQHDRKLTRRGFELQLRSSEDSGFRTGALSNFQGEGTKIRLDIWNGVYKQHETKMDNLAHIYEDFRDDYIFSIDASREQVLKEDAFSVHEYGNGTCELRIHVLDLLYYIRPGTILFNKFISKFGVTRSLKETLSMDLNKDDVAFSLCQRISSSGDLIGPPVLNKSIVKPSYMGNFLETREYLENYLNENPEKYGRMDHFRAADERDQKDLNPFQKLNMHSRGIDVDKLAYNYALLNKTIKKVVSRLPEVDEWYGINKYGIDVEHFHSGQYKMLYKANKYLRKRESILKPEMGDTDILMGPMVLVQNTMVLANLLMFRFLLTEMSHDQLDYLQTVRVFPPYEPVISENGDVRLDQNVNVRWTSPIRPNDFYTHVVLKQIAFYNLRRKQNTKERTKRIQKRKDPSIFLREQIRQVLPKKRMGEDWKQHQITKTIGRGDTIKITDKPPPTHLILKEFTRLQPDDKATLEKISNIPSSMKQRSKLAVQNDKVYHGLGLNTWNMSRK